MTSPLTTITERASSGLARSGDHRILIHLWIESFEMAQITVEALDGESATLSLIGKGDKELRAYLGPGTMTAVRNWLFHQGEVSRPLFLPLLRTGWIDH